MNRQTLTAFLSGAIACMTLATLSTAAIAQSMEYRRGYDQGFRDGAASVQGGQQRHGGYQGRVVISEAIYGTRDRYCDARQTVQQIVDNSQPPHFDIRADNQLCGDPARDRVKQLSLRYRCGNGPEQRLSIRENEVVALNCQ